MTGLKATGLPVQMTATQTGHQIRLHRVLRKQTVSRVAYAVAAVAVAGVVALTQHRILRKRILLQVS
jgi:hypothetical protein